MKSKMSHGHDAIKGGHTNPGFLHDGSDAAAAAAAKG